MHCKKNNITTNHSKQAHTIVKVFYLSSQTKVISATVIIRGELPYFLCQERDSAGYYLSVLIRLLIQHSEKNKQGSEDEEVVWTRFLLYATFWNSLLNGIHLFVPTSLIFSRHLIAYNEKVYGRS